MTQLTTATPAQRSNIMQPTASQSIPEATTPATELNEEEEAEMMAKLLGFSSFTSTKGQHVIGSDISAADIIVVPNYRQYMHKKRKPKE